MIIACNVASNIGRNIARNINWNPMLNIPPIKSSSPIKVESIPEVIKTWKVGQILNATTEQGGKTSSTVFIRVGQYTLEAKTPVTLEDGEAIKLEVKSITQDKLPLLRIIKTSLDTSKKVNLAALKLRQFIATQQTLNQTQQLAAELISKQTNSPQAFNKLPDALNKLLIQIQNTLQLDTNNTNAAELKQKILNSGIFLESKLLSLKTSPPTNNDLFTDFKQQLLNIKAQLTPLLPQQISQPIQTTPLTENQLQQLKTILQQSTTDSNEIRLTKISNELFTLFPKASLVQLTQLLSDNIPKPVFSDALVSFGNFLMLKLKQTSINIRQLQEQITFRLLLMDFSQQVDQNISKITSLQLQPLTREADNLVLLFFNLIFKDDQQRFDINFKIQQDNSSDNQDDDNWSVTLSFNFKTLGKVQSKIHLTGNQISTSFHTEKAATATKINSLLPLFESALIKSGFDINSLHADNTLLKDQPFIEHHSSLLDEQA